MVIKKTLKNRTYKANRIHGKIKPKNANKTKRVVMRKKIRSVKMDISPPSSPFDENAFNINDIREKAKKRESQPYENKKKSSTESINLDEIREKAKKREGHPYSYKPAQKPQKPEPEPEPKPEPKPDPKPEPKPEPKPKQSGCVSSNINNVSNELKKKIDTIFKDMQEHPANNNKEFFTKKFKVLS